MASENIIIGLLALLVAMALALLLRRPPPDPAIALLQAAQERQGERLGALTAEMRAALAASETALGREMSDLASRMMQIQAAAAQAQQQAGTQAREEGNALRASVQERLAAVALAVEQVRGALNESQGVMRTAIATEMATARDLIDRKATESRTEVEARLREMREANDKRLADIQSSVQEKLGEAVEKQMSESFTRVIDQFNAIQAMMGNVQSIASQVGDLKRVFANVRSRGGWGEAQMRALLDDFLPPGTYETNVKLREDSHEVVEFAILMPVQGEAPVRLPVDAKFPLDAYERLLVAHDTGDAEGEAAARRALEQRIRAEAQKIREKYIHPPATTEFGVLYLPTEGLYAEVARIPGLIDEVGRRFRVFIAGPSLLPAMLRTIQLGHVTLALSRNAESVRELLSATKAEMAKMDEVFTALKRQLGTVTNSVERGQVRTRAIARKLRALDWMPADQAEALLELNGPDTPDDEEGTAP